MIGLGGVEFIHRCLGGALGVHGGQRPVVEVRAPFLEGRYLVLQRLGLARRDHGAQLSRKPGPLGVDGRRLGLAPGDLAGGGIPLGEQSVAPALPVAPRLEQRVEVGALWQVAATMAELVDRRVGVLEVEEPRTPVVGRVAHLVTHTDQHTRRAGPTAVRRTGRAHRAGLWSP